MDFANKTTTHSLLNQTSCHTQEHKHQSMNNMPGTHKHKKLIAMLDETLVSDAARDFVAVFDNYVYPWLQKDEDKAKYEEMWERLHSLASEIPKCDRVHLDEVINHSVAPLWSHGQTWSWK